MNTTDFNDSYPIDKLQVTVNIVYMITGSISAAGNLSLITVFLIYKKFHRKEIFLLIGLAIGDFLYGVGFLLGGATRLHLVLQNLHITLVTVWHCQTRAATFFFIFGPQVSSLMEVSISVDRFIAVSWPAVYKLLTTRYVITVICTILGYCGVSYCTGLILAATMDRRPRIVALCFGPQSSWPSYGVYYTLQIAVGYCSSIIIYMCLMAVLRYRTMRTADTGNMYDIQHKRQMKITRMLAISSFATLVLCVIPWIIEMSVNALRLSTGILKVVQPLTWICIQLHGIVPICIYIWKMNDLRKAFAELLTCRVHENHVAVLHS